MVTSLSRSSSDGNMKYRYFSEFLIVLVRIKRRFIPYTVKFLPIWFEGSSKNTYCCKFFTDNQIDPNVLQMLVHVRAFVGTT